METKGRLIFRVLILALIAAVCLTGCVTLRSETTIHKNGSGTFRLTMAMDQQVSNLAGDQEAQAFEGVKAALEGPPGSEVRPYLDPITGRRGVEFVVPFGSLNELGPQPDSSSDQPQPYTVSATTEGTVTTLNVQLNAPELAVLATRNGSGYPPITEQDRGLMSVAQAIAGVDISYALALPGRILDWSPQAGATYDPAKNELSWNIRPNAEGYNIMVQWDNAAAPEPIDAPQPAPSTSLNRTRAMANLNKYVQAMSINDERSMAALLTPDVVIINPLKDEYPQLFDTQSYKRGYTSVDLGQKVGTAEWSGKWKVDNKVFDLSGVDVLTFSPDGKIRSIQVYVDPAQAEALVKKVQ
jgi:hypothetical protein